MSSSQPYVLLIGAFVVGSALLGASLIQSATDAAFSASTGSNGSTFVAATLDLTDDDGGTALFNTEGLTPGSTLQRCLSVAYRGSFSVTPVRLYGTVSDAGLADQLILAVEEGSGGSFANCDGFTATRTLFGSGTLADFAATHADYGSGLPGFTPTEEAPERTYRVGVTLDPAAPSSAQGASTQPVFTWEVRSEP